MIEGPGASIVTVSGNGGVGVVGVFSVAGGVTVSLSGLTSRKAMSASPTQAR